MLRVGLIAQPPTRRGGTWALVRFLYQALTATGECCVTVIGRGGRAGLSPDIKLVGSVGDIQALGAKRARSRIHLTRYLPIRSWYPECDPLRYMPTRRWLEVLSCLDIRVVVGGGVLSGFPVTRHGARYITWVGTTFWEDRQARYAEAGPRRKLYYVLTRPSLSWIERRVVCRSARVLVQTPYTAEALRRRYGLPQGRTAVVPCPVDVDYYRPRERPARRHCGVRLVTVGRFTDPRKNLPLLLQAYARTKEKVPAVRLTVVGEVRRADVAWAREIWPTTADVEYCGPVDEETKLSILRDSDVFVCSSQQEGFGIAVLEAMSSGLPVISTKCGGPQFLIQNGLNGLLVQNGSASAISQAVLRVVNNPEERDQMGRAARAACLRRFSVRKVAQMLLTEIDGVWGTDLASASGS